MTAEALKRCIDDGDPAGVEVILKKDPKLARARIVWGDLRPPALTYAINAPFHGTCPGGHQATIVRHLLAAGADPEDRGDGPGGETALHAAVSLYEPEVTEVLIDAGADLEATGGCIDDGPPLLLAIHFASTECAEICARRSASVYNLPLAAALGQDVSAFFRGDALTEQAFATHPRSSSPPPRIETATLLARALTYAAMHERSETINALLALGADPAAQWEGATPLHWAAWWGGAAGVARLLEHGADPGAKDPRHEGTPLEWAIVQRDRCRTSTFPKPPGLEAAIDLLIGLSGTDLSQAARLGRIERMAEILASDPDSLDRRFSGGTALHWAVISGEPDAARWLVEHGADRTLPTESGGQTAREIAEQRGLDDLMDLL